MWSRGIVVGTETRYGLDGPWIEFRYIQENFLFSIKSRPVRGPTQPTRNEYWGSFEGRKVVIHLHLVSSLRMAGVIPPLPQCAFMSWPGKVYLYLKVV